MSDSKGFTNSISSEMTKLSVDNIFSNKKMDPLILQDTIKIMTISDVINPKERKQVRDIPTKKGLEMEIKPEGKGYFWYPKNHGYGKPLQIMGDKHGEGLTGTWAYAGEFYWDDHPFPKFKELVNFTMKKFYKPVRNINFNYKKGLPEYHDFPLLFYITKKFKSIKNWDFFDKVEFERFIVWTVKEVTLKKTTVLGKVVASKTFSDTRFYDNGVLLMGSEDPPLVYSFGTAEPDSIKDLYKDERIWDSEWRAQRH